MEQKTPTAGGGEHSSSVRSTVEEETQDVVTLQLFQLSGWLEMRGTSRAEEFAELVRAHGGQAVVTPGAERILIEASWYSRSVVDDAAEQFRNYDGAYVSYSYDLVPTRKPALR